MKRDHSGLPHGGSVIHSGTTSDGVKHVIEYSLKLDSNPESTGSVLVACARAAYRMNKEGMNGAKTVLDIAPAYLSAKSADELRAQPNGLPYKYCQSGARLTHGLPYTKLN